jgi:hypothetical protein
VDAEDGDEVAVVGAVDAEVIDDAAKTPASPPVGLSIPSNKAPSVSVVVFFARCVCTILFFFGRGCCKLLNFLQLC